MATVTSEERRARREALGIPVHDDPREHIFVDGYCTCGEAKPRKPIRRVFGNWPKSPAQGRRGKSNLDIIEDNFQNGWL